MTKLGFRTGIIAAGTALAVAAPVNASDVSISIFARASTICRANIISTAPASLHSGANNLGTFTELCNNVEGYTVTLEHPAGLTNAWIEVGGSRIPISETGTRTIIVDSNTPAYRERPLRLVLDQEPPREALFRFNAEAKGTIY